MIHKILVVALRYSYGKKERGESINKGALCDSFESLGYQVETVWIDEHEPSELHESLISKAASFDPDLIFFKLYQDEISIETLAVLKQNYFTVNWFGDDQWRFEPFSSRYALRFDACITTDKFSCQKYRGLGQQNIIFSQHASFDNSEDFEDISYQYDISFIGGKDAYRSWFINQLQRRGLNVSCFGNGWSGGRVSYKEMDNIFLTSKINLNLSNSTCFDVRYNLSGQAMKPLARGLVKKIVRRGSGSKNMSQMKARVFEIPVRGGFLISEYVPTLGNYYVIDEEIICYKDLDEAELVIKHYLENDEERECIKKAGVIRARDNHTFRHRTEDFMKVIEKFKNEQSGQNK